MGSPDFKGLSPNLLGRVLETLLTLSAVKGHERASAFFINKQEFWLLWDRDSQQAAVMTTEGKIIVSVKAQTVNEAIVKFILREETQCLGS